MMGFASVQLINNYDIVVIIVIDLNQYIRVMNL